MEISPENLDIFNKSVEYLKKNGVPSALVDTEYIFSEALKVSRNTLKYSMSREIKEEDKNKEEFSCFHCSTSNHNYFHGH